MSDAREQAIEIARPFVTEIASDGFASLRSRSAEEIADGFLSAGRRPPEPAEPERTVTPASEFCVDTESAVDRKHQWRWDGVDECAVCAWCGQRSVSPVSSPEAPK